MPGPQSAGALMSGVLTALGTMGAVVALGWLLGRRRVLGDDAARVLARTVFVVATPALLLSTVARADLHVLVSRTALATWTATTLVALVAVVVLRRVWHRSAADVTVGALAASYVNAGNIGLPLAVYLLDDPVAVVPTLLLQLLVLAPIAFTVLDSPADRNPAPLPTAPSGSEVPLGAGAASEVPLGGPTAAGSPDAPTPHPAPADRNTPPLTTALTGSEVPVGAGAGSEVSVGAGAGSEVPVGAGAGSEVPVGAGATVGAGGRVRAGGAGEGAAGHRRPRRGAAGGVARRVVTNPIVVATFAGLAVAALPWSPPDAVLAPFALVGAAAPPLALLTFGMSLAGPRATQDAPPRRDLALVVGLRSVGHPLVAWGVGSALGLPDDALLAVVTMASLPTAQNVLVYALHYRRGEGLARDAGLVTTLLCVPVLLVVAAVWA